MEEAAEEEEAGEGAKMKQLFLAMTMLGVAVAFGQDVPSVPATEWTYSKQDDALHGASYDQFVLEGKFLTAPSVHGVRPPSIVLHCSNGKLRDGFLFVGAVAQFAANGNGGVSHSLKGATQAHVEMRWDEKNKPDSDWWEISNDGQALSFDRVQLTKLLTGHLLGHPGNPSQLVHRQIIGVTEAFGNEVVMQFDMPRDATRMVDACGLEWGKGKRR